MGTYACADQRNDCGRNCHSPIPTMSRKKPPGTLVLAVLRSSCSAVMRQSNSSDGPAKR